MRVADTAGMGWNSRRLRPEPPSAKDIVEEYRRKRLAKEAKERRRGGEAGGELAEVANEATTSPAPEPAPPAPSVARAAAARRRRRLDAR